jgi:DNA-binding PadR family transcriptional regulator
MNKNHTSTDSQNPLRSVLTSMKDETLAINCLDEWVLCALLGKESYGLEIIQTIKEAQIGIVEKPDVPSVGSLYTSLHRLEQRNYVTSRMEEQASEKNKVGARRRYYRITRLGMSQLEKADRIRHKIASTPVLA